MKVLIPAKGSSSRCKHKNFRPFDGEDSLVDVLIYKLVSANIASSDIFVCTDDKNNAAAVKDKHKVNVVGRNEKSTRNTADVPSYLEHMVEKIPDCEDIAIALCTTPTFSSYKECLQKWNCRDKAKYTSLSVSQPAPHYLLMERDERMFPVGWSFGNMHTATQYLPNMHVATFVFQILNRKAFNQYRYFLTPECLWHVENHPHIDINTELDFLDAQAVFGSRKSEK